MKIALMHYHLKPGGVTTVLKQQAAAISEMGEVLIITGQPSEPSFPFDSVYIPGIGYDQDYDREDDQGYDTEGIDTIDGAHQVAQEVETAVFSRWKTGCDVLHVHNPTLKKNRKFLSILKQLQKRGLKLFLQIHDFAEDGRPQVYYEEAYPADCHYGVINSRDEAILRKAGLKKKGLHLISNTIQFLKVKRQPPKTEPFILYPVRALRRKNIGEALLLSLFFEGREALYITLPPNSPADILPYRRWKHFTKEANLKVVFEAGLSECFPTLVRSAKFIITTSITEGFGFCFLEPWTAAKFLWGRKLPDICRDFETNGIMLDHFYDKLRVPLAWLGKDKFHKKWAACIETSGRLFDFHPAEKATLKAFEKITKGETIDFGLLDEAFQKKVITRALSGKKDRQTLIRLNPYLAYPGNIPNRQAVVENNLRAITEKYNRQRYQKTLMTIYARVTTEPVRHRIDKQVLLNRFFDLKTFSLLKWGQNDV